MVCTIYEIIEQGLFDIIHDIVSEYHRTHESPKYHSYMTQLFCTYDILIL